MEQNGVTLSGALSSRWLEYGAFCVSVSKLLCLIQAKFACAVQKSVKAVVEGGEEWKGGKIRQV